MQEMTNQVAEMVLHTPTGYRYTLVIVAYTKRVLVSYEMPVGVRLRMLEAINGFVDKIFTEAALALIEPACDTAMEMIRECMRVDEGNPRCGKAFDLMASSEVFGHLLKLNPSMLAAIKLFPGNVAQARSQAPQPVVPTAPAPPAHPLSREWWQV
jgi:hypothetical protein